MKNFLIVIALLLAASSISRACRFTVREIGFADFGVDNYTLYFFKDAQSTDEQAESFAKIAYAAFLDANVTAKVVDVSQKDHDALQFYSDLDASKQQVALVSSRGDAITLTIDRLSDNFLEEIWSLLEDVLSSPTREKILADIVKTYAVVLIVEGDNDSENRKAFEMVSTAISEIKVMMPGMPKPVEAPPEIIMVKKEEVQAERILLWSLGLDDVKNELPAITVLYGRCRQMGRLLPAGLIQTNIVRNLLAFVGADCECGLDRSWVLGRMTPTRWEADKQKEVIQVHKFDAENPIVKSEMSQILSISAQKARTQNNAELTSAGFHGYTEKEIEIVNAANEQLAETSQGASSAMTRGILISIVFLLVVLAGGALFFIKAQRKNS